jgi:hypothetical protein
VYVSYEDGDAGRLRPGVRVKVESDPRMAGTWPGAPTGIIEPFLGEAFRVVPVSSQPPTVPRPFGRDFLREYWVMFDAPQDDGSGDGPYSAASIFECYLEPIGEAELDVSPEASKRREGYDAALREVMEHPERGREIP